MILKRFVLLLTFLTVSTAISLHAQTPTEVPTGRRFHIQSAMNYGRNNGGYWDLPGRPSTIERRSNIQVWNLDNYHDREFTLIRTSVNGYYEIQVGNTRNSRVDIQGRGTQNGANVHTWTRTGNANQQFLFHHLGSGRFKIYDRNSGKILCLQGRRNANGTNVHLWNDHNGASVEWYLIDVRTKEAFIPGRQVERPSTPATQATSVAKNIASLGSNEILVYGKIGLNDNGSEKYTFAMTRTPNRSKEIYRREIQMPYAQWPVLRGGQMRVDNNPPDYDKYDYFVVFNGQKIGPYDRIYDMHQKEGDINKWITPNGKHISFAGVKGQRYFPILGNNQSQTSFWTVLQAPSYDPKSNRNTYAMEWGPSDFRLFENGTQKLTGWRNIKDVTYADNNRDLLYVGAPTKSNEFNVYLNHNRIGGPFTAVTQVGFLPGLNKPYYSASKNVTVNNTRQRERELLIGDRKFNFTHEQHVGRLEFADPWVVFTVSEGNKGYTGNDDYKKRTVEIWEYNFRSGELLKHGGYGYFRSVQKFGKSIYYSLRNPQGDILIVSKGGKVLDKVSKGEVAKTGAPNFKVSPNGDIYTYARIPNGQTTLLKKNGQPFVIPGVDKVRRVEILEFNPNSGALNLVVTKDEFVGGEDRTVINGSNRFDIKGRAFGGNMFFAENGTDVISLVEFKRGDDKHFTKQIYKNGKPASDLLFKSVREFAISPDASRYAALVTEVNEDFESVPYFTENQYMDIKRKLMVDGKIVEGNFGAPVWSKERNKFLVLQQVGNQLRLVEL